MPSGARFAKWGLGLFIFGVFLTLGIIGHYCAGARWPTGELFKQNISLWWACPWTLSVAAVQAGGLGMVALGLTRMLAGGLGSHDSAESPTPGRWSASRQSLACIAPESTPAGPLPGSTSRARCSSRAPRA